MTVPVLCGLDLETTGLDFVTDHITELAYIIKPWGAKKAGLMVSEVLSIPEGAVVPPFIEELTGITTELLSRWGSSVENALIEFLRVTACVDFFVAHNGNNFDRPFLWAKIEEYGLSYSKHPIFDKARWLDSQHDIEHKGKSNALSYACADHGFLNPFPHAALFDAASMLKMVDMHPIDGIVARSRVPWVIVRALATYDQKELVKAARFRWEEPGNGKRFEKQWVKMVKEDKVQAEADGLKAVCDVKVLELA